MTTTILWLKLKVLLLAVSALSSSHLELPAVHSLNENTKNVEQHISLALDFNTRSYPPGLQSAMGKTASADIKGLLDRYCSLQLANYSRDNHLFNRYNYILCPPSDMTLSEYRRNLKLVYHGPYAKLKVYSTTGAKVVILNIKSKEVVQEIESNFHWIDMKRFVNEVDANGNFYLFENQYSDTYFNINSATAYTVAKPSATEVNSNAKISLSREKVEFEPSTVPIGSEKFYSDLCADPALKGLFQGCSLELVYNQLGNPKDLIWSSGYSLVFDIGLFGAKPYPDDLKDTRLTRKMSTLGPIEYSGDYPVLGIKPGMSLNEVATQLGFTPKIEFDDGAENGYVAFSKYTDDYWISYQLSDDLSISSVFIKALDEGTTLSDEKKKSPQPVRIEDYPVSQLEVFEFGNLKVYNHEGFYVYEPYMHHPVKISSQNMRIVSYLTFLPTSYLYVIGAQDRILYQLDTDNWIFKPILQL